LQSKAGLDKKLKTQPKKKIKQKGLEVWFKYLSSKYKALSSNLSNSKRKIQQMLTHLVSLRLCPSRLSVF
jgi:hypothetical protein